MPEEDLTKDMRLPAGWTIDVTDYKMYSDRWIAVASFEGMPIHRATGSTVPIARLLVAEKVYGST